MKLMPSSRLLLSLTVLLVTFAGAQAIKCYVCAGSGSGECISELPEVTNCNLPGANWCTKIVTEGDKISVARTCNVMEVTGCTGKVCSYSCNTDGCNGSTALKITNLHLLLAAIAVAFKVMM